MLLRKRPCSPPWLFWSTVAPSICLDPKQMPEKVRCKLVLNGEPAEALVASYKTLLEALREDFGLTGTKHGCELGECGACTVLLDGEPVLSCLALLEHNPNPTRQQIKEATAGNLCRCTGYNQIVEAVEAAAAQLRKEAA